MYLIICSILDRDTERDRDTETQRKVSHVLPGGVVDTDMANIPHHQVWGEGMFGDEQNWSRSLNVQMDPGLPVRAQINLFDEESIDLLLT